MDFETAEMIRRHDTALGMIDVGNALSTVSILTKNATHDRILLDAIDMRTLVIIGFLALQGGIDILFGVLLHGR